MLFFRTLKGHPLVLPSRGCCHGVFLLGHAARLKEGRSVADWTQAARERSTFMSRALQLDDIAQEMLNLGLAYCRDGVRLANSLHGLSDCADNPTFLAIARLLLKTAPPSWIWFAVSDGQVTREYVPASDLDKLAWIGPELDQMLLDVFDSIVTREDDDFRKAMGDAAELMVLAALRRSGANPLHVSRIADSYGYDIECAGQRIDRIEVKAAGPGSKTNFYISRNEFEKCAYFGPEWRLVQVIFSGEAFLADFLDATHVETVRELRHGVLGELVPKDTPSFRWTESAQISPPGDTWLPFVLALDPDFKTQGFRHKAYIADVQD